MPTLEQIRLQLEHSLADLRMMEIAQRPAGKWAEEKAAFARGEVIEWRCLEWGFSEWRAAPDPAWCDINEYRIAPAPAWTPKFKVGDRVKWSVPNSSAKIVTIMYQPRGGVWQVKLSEATVAFANEIDLELAPWTLSHHLPGFRALADGEEWHRLDGWKEEMLPEGWRPFLLGETGTGEIQVFGGDWMEQSRSQDKEPSKSTHRHCRTNRPLPALPTERVALTPEDVPPGSVFRGVDGIGKKRGGWMNPIGVKWDGALLWNDNYEPQFVPWKQVMETCEILRPGQTDWQPCSKESHAE